MGEAEGELRKVRVNWFEIGLWLALVYLALIVLWPETVLPLRALPHMSAAY